MKTTTTLAAHLHAQAKRRDSKGLLPLWSEADGTRALTAALHLLPHGSGIDGDWTESDISPRSSLDGHPQIGALKISFEYHPMDDSGYYLPWRSYTLTARPGWQEIEVSIEDTSDGEDHEDFEDVLDHLHEWFQYALSRKVEWTWDHDTKIHRIELLED